MTYSTTGPDGWPHHQPSPDTRLALVEREVHHIGQYARDRTNAHSERISALDERTRKIGSRTGQLSDTVLQHAAVIAKIDPLAVRVAEMEARAKERRTISQWALAAAVPMISIALIIAGAAGKISQSTVDQALPQLGKLIK